LQQAIAEAIERPVEAPAPIKDLLSLLMPPPRLEETEDESRNLAWRFRKTVPRDYLELEARDPALGRAGEEFVLQFEHRRLCDAGQKTLAGKIEHIARTEGDNAGYDIRSFENNGRERLIEVKTTRFGMMTPFFASKNEVRLSTEQQEGYHLYRLFKFGEQPRMFILSGALRDTCQLEPALYSARPR
ncbi:MAG TPA: DUF3883 domain-containing protein, partial [Verrucomicrobiae bacterium]|nr:DUF3883 domain-containing protein [Verrucomicrobiae bacterium]